MVVPGGEDIPMAPRKKQSPTRHRGPWRKGVARGHSTGGAFIKIRDLEHARIFGSSSGGGVSGSTKPASIAGRRTRCLRTVPLRVKLHTTHDEFIVSTFSGVSDNISCLLHDSG